ncbi:MAG: serine hydrolase domain-containing protein [Clostridiaceae bacterium]|nr:serine hydrolase domain-containing protein [Clostridiaceae bacterium]
MNELTKKLSEILRYGLAKDFTSISYAIMKDGEFLAYDSLGNQGGEEKKSATPECTYNVASVSKIYCTVAVMQLVERGRLDLDTPVCEYLPRFRMPDQRYRKITLRHCLSHTSGLPGTQWKGFSVSDTTHADYYEDVYSYLSKNCLKAEPGEYAVYCNDGFTLAEMTVAEITGEKYADYCVEYITDPIKAYSSRLSPNRNEAYPLIHEGKKPGELLLIQGGAGFTTNMRDLCLFGKLFLNENDIISEHSKDEMAKKHGRTFLKLDERTESYGLGWDNVCYTHPEYDLGDGAMLKGGNSFQFTTQFIVVPKYNAVLAISETHDCNIDVNEAILRLFAVAVLSQGISIYKNYCPLNQSFIKENEGTYLIPSGILNFHLYGAHCTITLDDTRGDSRQWLKNFNFDGDTLSSEDKRTLYFEKHGEDTYALASYNGIISPMAQKILPSPSVSKAWKNRIGKAYIAVDTTPYDIVINEIMTGFMPALLKGNEGVVILSFSGRGDGGVYGIFESAVKPLDDSKATGFLNTPCNPSRDALMPIFEMRNGIEYCSVASYTYRDASSLPLYEGQGFEAPEEENKAYRFAYELSSLPKIPDNRRLMVLDDKLICVYDSLTMEKYNPIKNGYLLFI